jgi:hypothetical protein
MKNWEVALVTPVGPWPRCARVLSPLVASLSSAVSAPRVGGQTSALNDAINHAVKIVST